MLLPGGSKASSASNKHKNSFQVEKQLAAVAQAAQKRAFLAERKQKAQASPSIGVVPALAATAVNPPIQPPPSVPPPTGPSPSAYLLQQQTATTSNTAYSEGSTGGAIQNNDPPTQLETQVDSSGQSHVDSLGGPQVPPPVQSRSISIEDRRTELQYVSTAGEPQAQDSGQPYASTTNERQARHLGQSYASTSGELYAQIPTRPEVPLVRSDPPSTIDHSRFPDVPPASTSMQEHLNPASSSQLPTHSGGVPPSQTFTEIPAPSWEQYHDAPHQPPLPSDPNSSYEAQPTFPTLVEPQSSFDSSFDTLPASSILDEPVSLVASVSLREIPPSTQSEPTPIIDHPQFPDEFPAPNTVQQYPQPPISSYDTQPAFSTQEHGSSYFYGAQHTSSIPDQYIILASGSVGAGGDFVMDCEGDGLMDIDDEGPPYGSQFYRPSQVQVPFSTPTTTTQMPAQIYDSPYSAERQCFIPASYQPPIQPLCQPPAFVQDTSYYENAPQLPAMSNIIEERNNWLPRAVVSPNDSGFPYIPSTFAPPPPPRSTCLAPTPIRSACWRQVPEARNQPLRDSMNYAATMSSLPAKCFIRNISLSSSLPPRPSKWAEVYQDCERQEGQKGQYHDPSSEPTYQEESVPESFMPPTRSNPILERDIRPLPSDLPLSTSERPIKFDLTPDHEPYFATPQPVLRPYAATAGDASSVHLGRSGQRRKREDDVEGFENGGDYAKRFKASEESTTQHARPPKRHMPGHFPLGSLASGQTDPKASWRRKTTNCGFCDALPVLGAFLRFFKMP